MGLYLFNRSKPITCLADDLDILFPIQTMPQPDTKQWMVICKENPHWCVHGILLGCSGLLEKEVDLFRTANELLEASGLATAIREISRLEQSDFDTKDSVNDMQTSSYKILNQNLLPI
jgi:hypothetical protein